MKAWPIYPLILAVILLSVPSYSQQGHANGAIPKYDPAAESVFKGTVEDVRDRVCGVSKGALGSHVILKVGDGTLIEVHIAPSSFVKTYGVVFNKGDQLEVRGTKVRFEDVETIFAREIKDGNDTLVFRDKEGRPIW